MKTSDLVVGRLYAFCDSQYEEPSKVKVLRTNVQYQGRSSSRYWRNEAKTGGVEVRFGKSKVTTVVLPRHLVFTWVEHLERKAEEAAEAVEEAKREAKALAEGAATAFAVHQALLSRGVPMGQGYAYNDQMQEALEAAGFERYDGVLGHFHSTVAALDDLVSKGKVGPKLLGVLVGTVPAPSSPEMDYDLTEEEQAAEQAAYEKRLEANSHA